MAGQTNSWIGTMQISPVPCIGDTIRKTSSANEYYADGTPVAMETNADGSPIQTASLWWLIGAGLLIGLLMKSKSKRYA